VRILILSKIKTLASNGKAYKNVPARQILNLTEQESISGDERGNAPTDIDKTTLDTGSAIGKCENFLIYTFVILGAYTAIAIIFTAKAIVRAEDMRKNSLYYLAGTLVNVSYSILVALIAKLLISYVESLPSTFTFSIT
jgi:hypothetical protein